MSPTRLQHARISPPLLCSALFLCGCAASTKTIPAGSESPLVIIETRPASEPVRGEDLYPLTPAEWTYQIPKADGTVAHVTYTVSLTDRFDSVVSLAKGQDRTEFWALDENGNIVMPATIDHPKNALTLFDPPLLIAPSSLKPGEPCLSESDMKVVDARNPKRTRESGRATRTLEYVDDQLIRTPMGEFLAKRVVVTFRADLRFADADKTGTYWVIPGAGAGAGMGVVAQEHSEAIYILGLLSERKHTKLVLVEKR